MSLYDRFHVTQSEAKPPLAAASITPIKPVEDSIPVVVRDATSVVTHRENNLCLVPVSEFSSVLIRATSASAARIHTGEQMEAFEKEKP